jgi:intracellular multiplication protein IcmL
MDRQDALIAVITRNAFYQRLHYLALTTLALAILMIGILISVLVYMYKNPSEPVYFATDEIGRLIEIVPTSSPNMTSDDVINWTVEAVESALSYDYVNYHAQLQNAQKYFTSYGWSNYMSALKSSNNLLALTQRKMVVVAKVVDKPTIVKEGLLSGSYAWKMDIPILMTYFMPPYDDKSKITNPIEMTILVQRQSVLQSYKGLGVVQLIGSIATAPLTQPQGISTTPTG